MNNSINWLGNKVIDPNAKTESYKIQDWTTDFSNKENYSSANSYEVSDPVINQGPNDQGQNQQGPDQGQIQPGPTEQGPPPASEEGYIPAYLRRNIGKNVRAEFIIGTSQYTDRTGVLIEVGINYFVLNDVNSRTNIMCDLYSVKFVTVLQST